MRLGQAVELTVDLLKKHNLQKWSIEIDNSVSMSGWCSKKQKIIGLSQIWIKVCNENEVRDTILHEIAHALVKESGHGKEWKTKATEIGAIPKAKVDRMLFMRVENKIRKLTK